MFTLTIWPDTRVPTGTTSAATCASSVVSSPAVTRTYPPAPARMVRATTPTTRYPRLAAAGRPAGASAARAGAGGGGAAGGAGAAASFAALRTGEGGAGRGVGGAGRRWSLLGV